MVVRACARVGVGVCVGGCVGVWVCGCVCVSHVCVGLNPDTADTLPMPVLTEPVALIIEDDDEDNVSQTRYPHAMYKFNQLTF